MKPQLRLFWLIVLLTFISGCSGYQVACNSLSEVETGGGEEFGRNCDLEPGDNVRINLMDGKQVDGIIQSVSPREIVLDSEGDDLQNWSFTADQVRSIEKMHKASNSTIVLGLLIIGVILFAIGIGMANMDLGL